MYIILSSTNKVLVFRSMKNNNLKIRQNKFELVQILKKSVIGKVSLHLTA